MTSTASGRAHHRHRQVQRRRRTVLVATVLLLGSVGWLLLHDDAASTAGRPAPPPGRATGAAVTAPTSITPSNTPSITPSAAPSLAAPPTPSARRPVTARPTAVRPRGTGHLVVVPGRAAAPGRGRVTAVRVEVEQGVDVDRQAFADTVLSTLNDPRSWGHGGRLTFARTDGPADVVVVLASPDTSADLCRPLVTYGKVSCRRGARAILTAYRWVLATKEFTDVGAYRQYVVNHEVGHVLGRGHEQCGGAGQPAPVMQQQTLRVAPCRPNPWPYP